MKKITIALVLISLAGMVLFAEGSQEETTWEPGSGYMGRGYANPEFNIESLTLTGKIDLSDVNVPKLTVGENTYELMVPYRLDYDIDIKDGDEITISGFEVPAYRRAADSELVNLMVTGATFDGKEYDLGAMNYSPMGYSRGPAMMNNYGPAYGQKGRSGRFNNSGFRNNSGAWGSQPYGMMHTPYNHPYRR